MDMHQQAKLNIEKPNSTYIKYVADFLIFALVLSLVVIPIPTRASFADRCTAAGVVLCTGFDSAGDVDSFVYADDQGRFFGTYNEQQKSSGTGSMRFEIPTLSPANSSGGYERIIEESGSGFLPGETVYLQYREYFDASMLNDVMGGAGWKQVELTTTFGAYNDPVGIGLFNQDLAGAVKMYIASTVYTPDQNVNYVSDQWMTFYYKVVIGQWGTPTSQVAVWVGINDQPMQQIYNMSEVVLNSNPADVGQGYNKVIISPRNNGKLDTVDHPAAYTWFDELIVSTQPIADPAADTQAPTAPFNLTATANSTTQIDLSWSASTDNIGVSGYKLFRDGVEITSTNLTQYNDINLTANTEYSYTVLAMDAAGNYSDQSAVKTATTLPIIPPADAEDPTTPQNLAAVVDSTSQISLSWDAATDNVGVVKYNVYDNGSLINFTDQLSYIHNGLTAQSSHSYQVSALDEAGNESVLTTAVDKTTSAEEPTPIPDTVNPTQPSSVTAQSLSTSAIKLAWIHSTDNISVVGYKIFRDNVEVASVASNSYEDTNLSPSTEYTYTVRAVDAAGNLSDHSAAVTGNTQANSSSGGGGSITLPVINNFSVSSVLLKPNQSAVLQWNVYNSYDVAIDHGIGAVLQNGITTITPTITTTYTITAKNIAGQITKSITVVVDQEQRTHNYSDGTLLIDNGTIYVIEYGVKRPFSSMSVFLSYGYKLQNVIAADTSGIRQGGAIVYESLKHVRGSVVVDAAGTVWFIGTDYKYAFPSETIFLSWGNKFADIVPATVMDLLIPTGPIVVKK